jgi:copper resistance protein B
MKMLMFLLLAWVASPVLAGQDSSQAPTGAPAVSSCTPEHAAMGHCTLPPVRPVLSCTPEHAAMGHCNPPPAPPATPGPGCTPEHAAMGHCTLPPPSPQPEAATTPAKPASCTPEHAAMGHCSLPAATSPPRAAPRPAPSASCTPEHAAMGHCTLTTAAAQSPPPLSEASACAPEHAAMGHCTLVATQPPITQPPASALSGPENAADAVYGAGAMALARETLRREHGDMPAYKILLDRVEARLRNGSDGFLIDTQAWYGGDIDKVWLKTEVEGEFDHGIEDAEVQALWSRAITPWFDLQGGVRYDVRRGPDRAHLALGVQGLAPYWWEIDAALFLSTKGDVTARFEAEHDVRITQDLNLQPRAELDFSFQDISKLGLGSGFTNAAVGARLRYQVSSTFAPYVGLEFDRAFGDTARFARASGQGAGGWNLIVGLRTWF